MQIGFQGDISKNKAVGIIAAQAILHTATSLSALKQLNQAWKKACDDRDQIITILQETTHFLLDRADAETHVELNKNLDYWRIIRGIDPPCDCPAHDFLGRECDCTCDHSKDESK